VLELEERLRELGAEDISTYWLVNMVSGSPPAAHVKEAPCWPAVVRVELAADYWDIAVPPWDPNLVGEEACPMEGDQCTEHCSRVLGSRVDPDRACREPSELVACSRIESPISSAFQSWSCSARTDTGELYWFSGIVPTEPGYAGFRPCTVAEASGTADVPSCQ
jgi:hypothetical protein